MAIRYSAARREFRERYNVGMGYTNVRGSGWVSGRMYGSAPRLFNALDRKFRKGRTTASYCHDQGFNQDRHYRASVTNGVVAWQWREDKDPNGWQQLQLKRC